MTFSAALSLTREGNHEMQSPPPDGTAAPSNTDSSLAEEKAETIKRSAPMAGDILYGADEIAQHLFGDRRYRRRIYNLVERSVHNLSPGNLFPHFRIGASVCARKSTLRDWIAAQEERNAKR
jgi:hypothetical protein